MFGDFKIADKFAFVPQIIYSSQGFHSKNESTFPSIDFANGNLFRGTTTICADYANIYNYLNFPLAFKYTFKDNFSVIFGPQSGYVLKAKIKGDFITDGVAEEENDSYNFKPKLDHGLVFGLSYGVSNKLSADLSTIRV